MIRIFCDACKAEIPRRATSAWWDVWGTADGRPILQHGCSDVCAAKLPGVRSRTRRNWAGYRSALLKIDVVALLHESPSR